MRGGAVYLAGVAGCGLIWGVGDGRVTVNAGFKKLILLVCVGLVAYLCLWNLNYSIVPSDESLHIAVTQDIYHGGSYLRPTMFGVPYYAKPPFKIWLATIPLRLFGEHNWSYRILDGILGVATCLLLARLTWELFHSYWASLLSMLALVINPTFLFSAHGVRRATQDGMLAFLTVLAYLIAWRWFKSGSSNATRYAVGLGASIGCATLTKSFAGLLPLFFLALFFMVSPDGRAFLRSNKRSICLCLLITSIPACIYFLPHLVLTKNFYHSMVETELLKRLSRGYSNRHDYLYYLKQLSTGRYGSPWLLLSSLLLLAGTLFLSRARYRTWSQRQSLGFVLFLLMLPILLLSVLRAKLAWYLSPAYFSIAILSVLPWALNSDFSSRAATKYLIWCARLLIVCIFLFNLQRALVRVSLPPSRMPLDLALDAVRRNNSLPLYLHGPTLQFEKQYHNRVEKIYVRAFRERLHIIRSEEELPKTHDPYYLLISREHLQSWSARSSILATDQLSLPPARNQRHPLYLLAFGGAALRELKSVDAHSNVQASLR